MCATEALPAETGKSPLIGSALPVAPGKPYYCREESREDAKTRRKLTFVSSRLRAQDRVSRNDAHAPPACNGVTRPFASYCRACDGAGCGHLARRDYCCDRQRACSAAGANVDGGGGLCVVARPRRGFFAGGESCQKRKQLERRVRINAQEKQPRRRRASS